MAEKKSNRLAWLLAILFIGSGGFGAYKLTLAPKPEKVSFTTAEVIRGDIASWVTATGTLSPRVTVEVGSQISGRIQELFADFNTPVKKGQLVAKIDPLLFESDVASAKANVMSSEATIKGTEAQLANARMAYRRTKSLADKKLVAQSEADDAQAKLKLLEAQLLTNRAQLAQARANLSLKQTNLAYTQIHSPIDGVVISRDVDVGQTVAASMQAPTLFSIAEDLRKMEINTSVAESDVGKVKQGMAVEFNVDAYPNTTFHGVVKEVRYASKTEQNVVTYNAVVSVENPDIKLFPGMTAEVRFKVSEETNVLQVPNTALRFKPDETFLALAEEMRKAEMEKLGLKPPFKSSDSSKSTDQRTPKPDGRFSSSPMSPSMSQENTPIRTAGGDDNREKQRINQPKKLGKKMSFVWILDSNNQLRPIPVSVSLTDGKHSSITQLTPQREPPPGRPIPVTLKPGDKVITSYAGENARKKLKPMSRRGGFPGGPPPRR